MLFNVLLHGLLLDLALRLNCSFCRNRGNDNPLVSKTETIHVVVDLLIRMRQVQELTYVSTQPG